MYLSSHEVPHVRTIPLHQIELIVHVLRLLEILISHTDAPLDLVTVAVFKLITRKID